nr:hypothetical protein [Tanacetum cinerariifolium]
MAVPPRNQRHQYLRFKGLEYTDVDIENFKERLGKIYGRGYIRDRLCLLAKLRGGYLRFKALWRRITWREFILDPDKGDLSAYWRGISSEWDFLGTAPSYTAIRDVMLRGIDVGSVNIPNLLAWYLRRFASGRKREAIISGGQFVARLAEHFSTATVCDELDDTWAWVASGPKRQPDATTSAPETSLVATSVTRTMPQRMERLEEEVYEIRESLAEQREVMDAMARHFSSVRRGVVAWPSLTSLRAMASHDVLRRDLKRVINSVRRGVVAWLSLTSLRAMASHDVLRRDLKRVALPYLAYEWRKFFTKLRHIIKIEIKPHEHTKEKPYRQDLNAQDNMKQWKRCFFHKFTASSCYRKDVAEMLSLDDMLRIRVRKAGSDEEIFTSVTHQNGYANLALFISKLARKCRVLTENVVRSLNALIYCRDLDTITLTNLIDFDGKLIPEDPWLGVPRVGIPRPPRASMQDYMIGWVGWRFPKKR